ncbi:MAG: patatin-like phospholipase family protein [Burkholderiaceae bacterium]|nr:patatin-like phospholipase family protein [Burkholderiaceae bacterium]
MTLRFVSDATQGGRLLASGLIVALLAGCAAAPTRLNPITRTAQPEAVIAGIPGARHWGDRSPPGFEQWLNVPEAELKRDYAGVFGVPHTYLAISGGGADGAFGAGLLVGWTAQGTRPEFTVVTGISTGALIAPFAFLGPKYDPVLRKVYTELSTADLVERRGLLDIVRNDSLASTRPLRQLIAQYIDDAVIAEMAAEHRRGRSLLISTTNLDAARPVTWNITRIAASGVPGSHDLIHDVILASASIPGVFPPVKVEVEAGGRTYDEIHVDGGVTSQVFMYPAGLNWRKVLDRLQVPGRPKLYVIRNSRTDPGFETIERRLVPIMSRSVSSLIRTQGIGDMAIIYLVARRDGVDFNLAHVPDDFSAEPEETFDREYMRKLFAIGYDAALKGYPWITGPTAPE